ncbi:MAG: preprotein translocase subunit Sec61beta [Candidatus Micrarchaeaceae archaeon]
MPGLFTPQSSAGIQSFYDAPTNGPKINPKILVAAIVVFTVLVLVADHFLY